MPFFDGTNGEIYFEQYGPRVHPPLVLIHGVGCQIVQWPPSLVQGLVETGYRVILLDNRDAGFSFLHDAPAPSIESLLNALDSPEGIKTPYSLSDMAEDVNDLLNHIGQSGAHVVGQSMGGMIAQRLAIHHPERVFSLTVIMSNAGNPHMPKPTPEAVQALAFSVAQTTRETHIEAAVQACKILAGPHYDSREYGMGRFVETAYNRSNRPEGTARQFAAILTEPDRRPELKKLRMPVLAIHGEIDPLVRKEGSEDIVASVPNGKLELLPNVGHDLPEPVIPQVVELIARHCKATEAQR